MAFVVPAKELLAVSPGAFDTAEAIRKLGAILKRLEVRFGERVVVRNIWPAMRLRHFKVDQQLRDDLRTHACATASMQSERARFNALFADGVGC